MRENLWTIDINYPLGRLCVSISRATMGVSRATTTVCDIVLGKDGFMISADSPFRRDRALIGVIIKRLYKEKESNAEFIDQIDRAIYEFQELR